MKAPRLWPNNSDSRSVSGKAVQLTGTKGSVPKGELRWIALAISSFPVPLSPRITTLAHDLEDLDHGRVVTQELERFR